MCMCDVCGWVCVAASRSKRPAVSVQWQAVLCVWEGVTECVDVCGGYLRRFVRLIGVSHWVGSTFDN